jgi:hypothetical protein
MTDVPIIFSAPMILALLAGRKTMTRRLAWRSETDTKKMDFICDGEKPNPLSRLAKNTGVQMACAYWLRPSPWQNVKPGDRLWVRESHHALGSWDCSGKYPRFVWADFNGHEVKFDGTATASPRCSKVGWWTRPAIHMPRARSRLSLVVTATKIERLQSIDEDNAIAEGVFDTGRRDGAPYAHYVIPGIDLVTEHSAVPVFGQLWEKLHGPESWYANPEVVCLSFEVHRENNDSLKEAA